MCRLCRRSQPPPSPAAATDVGDDDDDDVDETSALEGGGGAVSRRNGAADKDPNDKTRTLKQRVQRSRWCKNACTLSHASWTLCKGLVCMGMFLIIVMFIVTAMTHVTTVQVWYQVKYQVPTEEAWEQHVACVDDVACDLCSVPVTLAEQSSMDTRIAAFCTAGAGCLWLRRNVEEATRVMTTFNTGDVVADDTTYPWQSSPFMYGHSSMTVFGDPDTMASVRGYAPTHLLLQGRDPFDEAMWAFHIQNTCSGVSSSLMSCNGRESYLKEFAEDGAWPAFALASAAAQMEAWAVWEASALPPGRKMLVYYEDWLDDRMGVLSRLFEFVPSLAKNPSRGTACAMAFVDPALTSAGKISVDQVFSSALVARMCDVVRARWSVPAWGNRCVSGPGAPPSSASPTPPPRVPPTFAPSPPPSVALTPRPRTRSAARTGSPTAAAAVVTLPPTAVLNDTAGGDVDDDGDDGDV